MARKDSRGRNLLLGESQRKDGMYQYRYEDLDKKRKTVYSWRLVRSDKTPPGKKEDIPLREKEADIQKMLEKGLNNRGRYLTLNDMFDSYLERKRHKGKPLAYNTKSNYQIMWNKHIRNSILGNKKVLDITKLDIVWKNNRDMYRKLLIMIDTMCRISELAGLTWDDIDMKNRMITIDHQLQFLKLEHDVKCTYHITPTKSRNDRYIPMTDEVYEVLKE